MTGTTSDAALDATMGDFFSAWERRDVEHIVSRFTEDAVYHNISLEPLVGKARSAPFLRSSPTSLLGTSRSGIKSPRSASS
jgi:limonene-1,2-epoxide hydrolase